MDTQLTLDIHNLSCVRQQKTIFSGLSFRVMKHECVLIEGPNGSGKSSLLRILCGLATPSAGDVIWNNQSVQSTRALYHENLHYISHANGIKLGLTVIENLQLAKHLASTSEQAVNTVLQSLKLIDYQHACTSRLSAGQKRRIALAKLFLFPKLIWILDEPLTTLDTDTQAFFLRQLQLHLNHGGMAIISSHHAIRLSNTRMQTLSLSLC